MVTTCVRGNWLEHLYVCPKGCNPGAFLRPRWESLPKGVGLVTPRVGVLDLVSKITTAEEASDCGTLLVMESRVLREQNQILGDLLMKGLRS